MVLKFWEGAGRVPENVCSLRPASGSWEGEGKRVQQIWLCKVSDHVSKQIFFYLHGQLECSWSMVWVMFWEWIVVPVCTLKLWLVTVSLFSFLPVNASTEVHETTLIRPIGHQHCFSDLSGNAENPAKWLPVRR